MAAGNLVPGFGPLGAELLTAITSLADILLGLFVLFRRHAIKAMLGMLLLSAAYLLAGTLLAPILWLDPLGPYVKVIPSMVLTLACLAIFNER
jgi:hydrogenase-4 membrane subunit HyfE